MFAAIYAANLHLEVTPTSKLEVFLFNICSFASESYGGVKCVTSQAAQALALR